MKRKILIITYTYFQLIVAVQLRQTVFQADDVDVIITDQSKDSGEVADRLRKARVFRRVFYVHDLDGRDETGVLAKYKRYMTAWLYPEKVLQRYVFLVGRYDIFLFHNASLLTHLICRHCGKETRCFRFEEGYSTYTRPLLEKKRLRRWMIRCAFGDLGRRIQGLYLFHPELFRQDVKYPLLCIRPLGKNNEELRQVLNRIFAYEPDPCLLNADYIFLEESFRPSYPEIDDVDLVCRIAGVVGKERLVVKQHPRSPDNPFAALGIATVPSGSIPWEVILMNEDLSGKTLLTVMSGAVLAPALYGYQPIKTYFLFRCVNGSLPMLDEAYLSYLSAASGMGDFTIPDSRERFLEALAQQNGSQGEKEI